MTNVPLVLRILLLVPFAGLQACSEEAPGPVEGPTETPAGVAPEAATTTGRESAEGAVEWRLISAVPWDELHERTDDRQWSLTFQFKGALLDRNRVYLMQGPLGGEMEKRRLAVRRAGGGLYESKLAVVQLPAGEQHQIQLRFIDRDGETHDFPILDGRIDPALVAEEQVEFLF